MDRFFTVTAGFPSPAEPWREHPLDLITLLLPHPDTTYFVRVKGSSMQSFGIFDGDVVIVDRLPEPAHGDIILAVLKKTFTIKQLQLNDRHIVLRSGHPRYPAFVVRPEMDFAVWGIVTCVLHPLHRSIQTILHPPDKPR
jgi:DNA polymerase V